MPFLTLVLTCPLVFAAKIKKQQEKKYYISKLFGLWLLCQLYITLNSSFRISFGVICALLIVYKTNFNKTSKFISLILGIASLLLSSIVYLVFAQ